MVTITPRGHVLFRIFAPTAQRVQLLGSFTGWDAAPIDLVPEDADGGGLADARGWFRLELPLQPGDHAFKYRLDNEEWRTDFAASGVQPDGFGGWNSLLHVPRCTPHAAPAPISPASGGTVDAPTVVTKPTTIATDLPAAA
jgi:hypothetical protein